MQNINRRRFLSRSAKSVVGLSAGAAALGARRTAQAASANEKIVLGVIGVGGRGSSLVRSFAGRPDVEFACLCDPDSERGRDVFELLELEKGKAPKRVSDFRRVLDDKDVDAIIVATPDHMHALPTILGCQAGKDVYVEKPASHNIWEGRKMVEAARKYKRIVQVGTQSRSAPYVHKALEYIHSGALGTIHLCKVYNLKAGSAYHEGPGGKPPDDVNWDLWLGPAPMRPYDRRILRGGWQNYWAYCGGDLASDGIHQVDLARWLIGKDYPKGAHCTGGNFAFQDDREYPDTQIAAFDFDDLTMTFEMTHYPPYMSKTPMDIRNSDTFPFWPQNSTRIELYGTKELMIMGRHGGGWQALTTDGKVVAQEYGRFPDKPHQQNFLECIRSRKRPNADIEEGHRSAILAHLANIAYRVGCKKLIFDAKTETLVGNEEANRLVKRTYREPYVIPENV